MSTTWPAAWNVVQDLRCIPELTTQDFLEFVIPPVPQQNLDNILRSLKSGAVTDGRIKGFDKDPRQAGLTKDEQFRHLHDFSERALAIASGELAATATLASRYTPHETPRSEKRNGSRPDKSLVLKDAPQPNEGRVGWQDIVLAFEFKLDDKDNDLYDNRRKTVWNSHHILRNDPRRLFTFGISIENTCCRFWYFSRSHVMVSQGFNFITDYEPYVQLLVGLAFAHVFDHDTTAVPGLLRAHGYDPTVQRLDNSGNYSIRVGDKTYITCGVLSDFRAESICGRCTRVWKVYEEGDETTFYALKDAWVDRRNQTEGEIWKRLKKDLNNEVFSKHFLTLGTLQFMACEVSAGSYLMRPRTPSVTLARRLFSLSDPQTSSPTPLGQRLPVLLNSSDTLDIPDTSDTDLHSTEVYDDADETPTFLHNPIHDLESVWWLLIWTLLRFHPKSTAPLDHNALRDQLGVFLSLFPGTQAQREHALQSINLNHTSTKISLIGTAQISEHVKYLSKVLVDMYTAVEKSFPIPNAAFDGAHSVVLGILKLISGRVGRIPVGTLVPIQATLAELEQGGRAKV
ncbi:hypothetical protein EYR40_010700 [Pleurotus pulmonarius]|nr:hypothetical protein EYR40_010700 [Pleurotus pulmonarius]